MGMDAELFEQDRLPADTTTEVQTAQPSGGGEHIHERIPSNLTPDMATEELDDLFLGVLDVVLLPCVARVPLFTAEVLHRVRSAFAGQDTRSCPSCCARRSCRVGVVFGTCFMLVIIAHFRG
jgi:hypothetical protein